MITTPPVADDAPLRLGAVLRSPHSERHGFSGFQVQSVPIGLNRAPDLRETRRIEGRYMHARLASAGYEHVVLRVESASLEVLGTSVAELDGELLTVLASAVDSVNRAAVGQETAA